MSHWKLVEAEAVVDPSDEQSGRSQGRGDQQRRNDGGKFRRNSRGGEKRQGGQRNNRRRDDNYSTIFVPDTPESRQAYATMAVQTM